MQTKIPDYTVVIAHKSPAVQQIAKETLAAGASVVIWQPGPSNTKFPETSNNNDIVLICDPESARRLTDETDIFGGKVRVLGLILLLAAGHTEDEAAAVQKELAVSLRVMRVPVRSGALRDEVGNIVRAPFAGLGAVLQIGPYELHLDRAQWIRPAAPEGKSGGAVESLDLTEKERDLLVCLYRARGQSVARAELLQKIWGYRAGVDTHTLETHIYRLRQKIEKTPSSPEILLTDEDGYRLGGIDDGKKDGRG